MAIIAAALVAACLDACDRPSFGSHLTPAQSQEIGQEAALQLESQYSVAPYTDPNVIAAQSVFATLASNARNLQPGTNLQLTALATTPEIAESLPDGHIFVSTGLLSEISSDPSMVEGMLAHEIGHVALEHDAMNLSDAIGDSAIADMLAQGKYEDIVRTQIELGQLSYSTQQEEAADVYAVALLRASGYDPRGLVRFVTAMSAEEKDPSQVSWNDTHPISHRRLAKLAQESGSK